jgi:hypothetical protein
MTTLSLRPRPVASSVEELLAGATSREPFGHSDSKSGSDFERVVVGGQPHVVKYLHIDDDWTMRASPSTPCVTLDVWRAGLMDVLPARIDNAMVGAAGGLGRGGLGAALLMRDVGPELVPAGDEPLAMDEHLRLLDDMAALAAHTRGWEDDLGLWPLADRWRFFSVDHLAGELERGWPHPVPLLARDGWERFDHRAPSDVRDVVQGLRADASALVDAASTTPLTFLHGDWKLGNLGTATDGRTVLIDWTYCGQGPPCYELGWYLAINSGRLPHSKEDAIAAFRSSLDRHGMDTSGWWERQLALCLLGTVVMLGWEKALGADAELDWWCDGAREGAQLL